jgi:glycosyltransferase involved in cell wall biosynthesis
MRNPSPTPILLSVVTVTWNCENVIDQTIDSIRSILTNQIEYIVIDGNSTDQTVARIRCHLDYIDHFISEPDTGIYNAMNKGVAIAKGKFVHFINAGDCVQKPGWLLAFDQLRHATAVSLVYGDAQFRDTGKIHGGSFSKRRMTKQNICHQSIFYGRQIFSKLGLFNERYKIGADHEFNIRCFADDTIYKVHLPVVVSDYMAGGVSSHVADIPFEQDFLQIIRTNFGWAYYALSVGRISRNVKQFKGWVATLLKAKGRV